MNKAKLIKYITEIIRYNRDKILLRKPGKVVTTTQPKTNESLILLTKEDITQDYWKVGKKFFLVKFTGKINNV